MSDPVQPASPPSPARDGAEGDMGGVPAAAAAYRELEVSLDDARTCWCWMRPIGAPSFTVGMLGELIDLKRRAQASARDGEAEFDWFVGGSRLPGIYNLGGDLGLFARLIRERAEAELTRYAHACVEVCYQMTSGFDLPLVTIALVQGEALGGGFEGALSFNVVAAERSARFGLPEVLFNLFPGMGAYSYLSRRLNGIRAERMILSGRIYTAEELFEMGLVDVLANDGEGEQAVGRYIAENRGRHAELAAGFEQGRRRQGLTHGELRDVTDLWVQAALRLTPADLRKMERLVAAQNRRTAAGR